MAGFTNKGKAQMLAEWCRGTGAPTGFYVALVTSAVAPTADTNTFSELTEIAAGNGYTTGGLAVARNATDFDTLNEDDANDRGSVQIKDLVWTASGGAIPASGNGARYAVLLDDNVTIASREVLAFWDLASDVSVSDGQTLTLQNLELRASEA